MRLDAAFRHHGQIIWLLRAPDDTWRFALTSEHLTDAHTPAKVLAMPAIGPFATREAAQEAGFAHVARQRA
jgi:hypothetical protein